MLICAAEDNREVRFVSRKDNVADACASFFGQHIDYAIYVRDVDIFTVTGDYAPVGDKIFYLAYRFKVRALVNEMPVDKHARCVHYGERQRQHDKHRP